MKLTDIKADTKEVWVEYEAIPGFEVQVNYVPRTKIGAMVRNAEETKFDRKTKQMVTKLDEKKFIDEFVAATVKNWKGLTIGGVAKMMPISIEVTDENRGEEIKYDHDSAVALSRECAEFDDWLNEVVSDVATFRK